MPENIAVLENRRTGDRWAIRSITTTSDGFKIGTGFLLDDDDNDAQDEGGFPIIHSFFLG